MKPKTLSIGPIKYTISYDQDRCDDYEWSYGFIKKDKADIIINPNNSEDVQKETLMHEILHGIWHGAGIEKLDVLKDEDNDEEKIVNALSPYLLDTLKRNRKVAQYLLEV